MDIVYILGKGSKWSNNELRYSLRSVEQYVEDIGSVFIVGECPAWLQNVIHLPCPPDGPVKERNIMQKIMVACNNDKVNPEFLLVNDDHFLLAPVDGSLPHYYEGTLSGLLIARADINNEYTTAVENTFNVFEATKHCNHYDIHCPMVINRSYFGHYMLQFNWDIDCGYLVKSLYANQYENDRKANARRSKPLPDCQLNFPRTAAQIDEILKDKPFFSIHDSALRGGDLRQWFEKRYPVKSRYEQDLPMETVFTQDQFDHWRYQVTDGGQEAIAIIAKDNKGNITLLPSDESGFMEVKKAMKYLVAALPG